MYRSRPAQIFSDMVKQFRFLVFVTAMVCFQLRLFATDQVAIDHIQSASIRTILTAKQFYTLKVQ